MSRVPLLTIGMPVYQGELYLSQALDSLLGQTFTDFQLIISDNHSQDATQEICERYAQQDCRIRYVRQAENIGVAGNFGYLLSRAESPYFMWAACDDLWDSRWVEVLLTSAQTNDCFAMGSVHSISEDGERLPALVDNENFTFVGGRLTRRLRFFLKPSMAGKANAIYGLGPRYAFTTNKVALLDSQGGDVAFVYCELEKASCIWCPEVALSKRTPVIRPGLDPGIKGVTRTAAALAAARRALNLALYLQESGLFERIILVGLAPVALLRILLATRKRFGLAINPQ